jgi:nephrocystin-3
MNFWKRILGHKKLKKERDVEQSLEFEGETESLPLVLSSINTALTEIPNQKKDDDIKEREITSQTEKNNRRIRIFVSSTFRDMIEDRNLLMTHCWPQLRIFCSERKVEMTEVDLRWGISEEQSTRKETLKLCLNEISACRPYFIGLLGERYGWIPGDDAYTADLKEDQPWLKDLLGKSVTELEILYGVLNNPEMAGHAFFYFRDPQYAHEKGVDFLPENNSSSQKQDSLKRIIRKTCIEKNIPLHENYPDPRSLATLVLNQLKAAIDKEFPLFQIPNKWEREIRNQESYAESRRSIYIGRPEYFAALDKHITGEGPPMVIHGESGSGKSALLINWIAHWKKNHPEDFIFQHYIGSSEDSAIYWMIMLRMMVEIKSWLDDPKELAESEEDIKRDFPLWLSKARIRAYTKKIRFIIVLDGLNFIEDKEQGKLLSWLPEQQFKRTLRLVIANIPKEFSKDIEIQNWSTLQIQPLTKDERKRMVIEYLWRFSKKLDLPRLERITNSKATDNPLYLKFLLDELRITGTHDKLDARLDDYLAAKDIPALLGKIIARYQKDYEYDRKGLVRDTLGLIWASRRGLSEAELLQLLKDDNLPQLPLAIWTPLRAALEENLIDRSGILNFANNYFTSCIEKTFVTDQETKNYFRLALANFFETQRPSLRNSDELPWLLMKTKLFDRLRKCLINIDHFLYIIVRNENELLHYWILLKEEKSMEIPYLDSFKIWLTNNKSDLKLTSGAAIRLGKFLQSAGLYVEAESLYKMAHKISVKILDEEKWTEPASLNNLATLYMNTNRLEEAIPLMERGLEIQKKKYGINHPEVALCMNNIAAIYKETNRLKESELLYKKAIKICELSQGKDHPRIASYFNNLANLYEKSNRFKEAELLLIRALKIYEKQYGEDHPEVALLLNNLAENYRNTDRLVEAEPLFRRAIKINEENLGESHPLVANFHNNLALVLNETKNFGEAEIHYNKAIKIYQEKYGGKHPLMANCIFNMALLYDDTNRKDKAEQFFKKALVIYEESEGEHRPDIINCLNNLALLLSNAKHFDESEVLLRRALKIKEEYFGKNHPEVAKSLNVLAILLQFTNRQNQAELLFRRALNIAEISYGKDHPNVIEYLKSLVQILLNSNRQSEAEQLIRRLLKIEEENLGINHPEVSIMLTSLASLLFDVNRLIEAEPLMRRALKIDEENFGKDHPKVTIPLSNLGRLLQHTKRFEEAEPLYRRMVEILINFNRTTGTQHQDFQACIQYYFDLLIKMRWSKEKIVEQLKKLGVQFSDKFKL